MRRLSFRLLAVVLLACATLPAQAPPILEAALTKLDTYAAGEFASDPAGSLVVGVVADGGLAWTRSYGFADAEAKRTPTDQTPYRVGSITKQFTALMLLQLAERGKVRLSDPLVKYVPEFSSVKSPYPEAPAITLLQLATMTSGLAREPSGPSDHSAGSSANWEQIVLDVLPRVSYAHEPGTRYLYCNIGYALLGLALGRAAGQPFTTYVRDEILRPLGMTSSGFEPTEPMRPLLARGYDFRKEGKPDWTSAEKEWNGRGYRVPNGGLISTMRDLAKFVAWELGSGPDTILKRETQQDNYTRVSMAAADLSGGYGLGFQVMRRGLLVAHGHGGTTSGFLSQAILDRESKTGVIVFRNVTGGKLNPGAVAVRALEIVSAARPKQTD
ncbi:MAG: serine hydrolase domain-containing protein [Vicinamibacterales bacterium]